MEKTCEKCGSLPPMIQEGPLAGQYHLLAYCVNCSQDLCPKCVEKGCCGHVPAETEE